MLRVIILAIAVAGCSASAEDRATKPLPVVGEFKAKGYSITTDEHVTVMDLPSRLVPERCWVYVNEKIRTSHMHCESDGVTSDLPAQGAELER